MSFHEIPMTVSVTQDQIDEAASLINNAIENHATAVDVTGLGVLFHIMETLAIRLSTS